jgi:hypothetical protein
MRDDYDRCPAGNNAMMLCPSPGQGLCRRAYAPGRLPFAFVNEAGKRRKYLVVFFVYPFINKKLKLWQ